MLSCGVVEEEFCPLQHTEFLELVSKGQREVIAATYVDSRT